MEHRLREKQMNHVCRISNVLREKMADFTQILFHFYSICIRACEIVSSNQRDIINKLTISGAL
jgi:hypothetical protein